MPTAAETSRSAFINTRNLFESGLEVNKEPYINVPTANQYVGLFEGNLGNKKQMMDYAKRQAIIMGIGNAILNDIFTKVTFKAIEKKNKRGRQKSTESSESREKDAMEFYKKHFTKDVLKSAGFDWLYTGEAFLWNGSVSEKKVREILFKLNADKDDIDVKGVPMLKHAPSTTMTPKYDLKNIIGFKQKVINAKAPILWTVDNIIHIKFMSLDGKPSGWTPMFSAKPIIETLGLIVDYAGHFFEGGGAPEIIFSFPKEVATSNAINLAKQEMQRFYKAGRRGHMFFAGEMKPDKINEWNKDMEFRQLFILYVGIIAFMFNMPLHRIQSILGGDVKSGAGSSDLSDSGYWRNIYEGQDLWETHLNIGFWNDAFGVDMAFDRTYLQDTFRETQATNMALTNVEMLERLDLIKPGFKKETYSRLLSVIPSEAINDNPQSMETNMMRQGMANSSDILRGQATKQFSEQKKKEAGKTSAEQKGM